MLRSSEPARPILAWRSRLITAHYHNQADLAARYVVQPSFTVGFRLERDDRVAKDWRNDPGKVIERIVARL